MKHKDLPRQARENQWQRAEQREFAAAQLLIAMMGNTYSQHQTLAQEEWRLVVTALTREYWDATVLPLPLNLFELLINDCVKACMKHRLEAKKQAQKRRLDAAGGLRALRIAGLGRGGLSYGDRCAALRPAGPLASLGTPTGP